MTALGKLLLSAIPIGLGAYLVGQSIQLIEPLLGQDTNGAAAAGGTLLFIGFSYIQHSRFLRLEKLSHET